LGFVDYNGGGLEVHSSLLNVFCTTKRSRVLHFQAETVLVAFWPSVAPVLIYQSEYCAMHNGPTGLIDDQPSAQRLEESH
jgi:hypothetical protein